jgi:hypothetical protein
MKTKKKIAMMIIFVIILKFLANQPDKLKRMNEKAIIDVNYDNILIAIVVFFKIISHARKFPSACVIVHFQCIQPVTVLF